VLLVDNDFHAVTNQLDRGCQAGGAGTDDGDRPR
jgi:hypothetical protein